MIDRLRQLSEPRLRQQAGIENSQTPLERDILVQWVRKKMFPSHSKSQFRGMMTINKLYAECTLLRFTVLLGLDDQNQMSVTFF